MAYLLKLAITPDTDGYGYQRGAAALAVTNEGPASHQRQGLRNVPTRFSLAWSVGPEDYDALQAHYAATGAQDLPFLVDLLVGPGDLVEVTAKFVPGTFAVDEVAGQGYRVSAQVDAVLPEPTTAEAEATVAAFG